MTDRSRFSPRKTNSIRRLLLRSACWTALSLGVSSSAIAQSIDWQHAFNGGAFAMQAAIAVETADGGYAYGAGMYPASSNRKYAVTKLAADRSVVWQRLVGPSTIGSRFRTLQETSDGGFLVGGDSAAPIGGDKTEPSRGGSDYWLVKLDANGQILWDKTLGGADQETLGGAIETSDGGYILMGHSNSGATGDKSDPNYAPGPSPDIWVVKLRADLSIEWDRTYGGTGWEYGALWGDAVIQQTGDGGYVLGASSSSGVSGDKSEPATNPGYFDIWVLKLEANGAVEWDRTIAGVGNDYLRSLRLTRDGGYILGGSGGHSLARDYIIAKLDAAGTVSWKRIYGGSDMDDLYSVNQTLDDGFIIAGTSQSGISGNKTEDTYWYSSSHPTFSCWILKLQADGSEDWQHVIGGSDGNDRCTSVSQTSDGRYLLGAHSTSGISGDKTSPASAGASWMVKLEEPLVGVSAFHFEDEYGEVATSFECSNFDIYLDGAASQNEAGYYIDAWRRPIGSSGPFQFGAQLLASQNTSASGWFSGTVGEVNLTDEFASVGYTFERGYEHQIKLAISNNPYFGWVPQTEEFVVPWAQHVCTQISDNDGVTGKPVDGNNGNVQLEPGDIAKEKKNGGASGKNGGQDKVHAPQNEPQESEPTKQL